MERKSSLKHVFRVDDNILKKKSEKNMLKDIYASGAGAF